MPNVIAGALIGAATNGWGGVLAGSALAWPLVYCVYAGVEDAPRLAAMAGKLGSSAKAYGVEFGTASLTALPTASVVHLVRSVLT